jgi:DNA-binding NarL/FixJ family response regulator
MKVKYAEYAVSSGWNLAKSMRQVSESLEVRAGSARKNVLIMEEEFLTALDLSDDLEKLGFKVTGVARDRVRAIECAIEARPDLAIIDMELSGPETGVEIASILKKRFSTQIIFLTGHSDSTTRLAIEAANPAGYLFKPYSAIALRDMLSKIYPPEN